MNKTIYKSSLKHISVSDNIVGDLISKISPEEVLYKSKFRFKILIPVAALLVASIITVSAAPALGLSDVFKGFFSQFFGTDMTDEQLSIIEKYGSAPNIKYNKDGVELNIEGIIGDKNLLYIKYSVSTEKKYDTNSLYAVLSPKLFIGDMKLGIQPVSITKTSLQDKENPFKFDYYAIYQFQDAKQLSGNTATLAMKFPGNYKSAGINLGETYAREGVSPTDNKDIYSIPNSKLGLAFDNEFGKILLDSIGYADGKLVLAVEPSGYYELPELYLRDKKTNKIYYRCDGYVSVNRNALELYPFQIDNPVLINDLEIVMLKEQHLSFPLVFTDKTKTIDLEKNNISVHNDTLVQKIQLSPLSLTIYGAATKGNSPSFSDSNCSLRLMDNTVLDNFKFSSSRSSNNNTNSFSINLRFEKPLEIQDVQALIIKTPFDEKGVEIPLN